MNISKKSVVPAKPEPQRRNLVHLRTCKCGVTLCCDSSPNRHASKHAHTSGHPVIASAQPRERWLYCDPNDAFAEYKAVTGPRICVARQASFSNQYGCLTRSAQCQRQSLLLRMKWWNR